ncbi:cytochrome c [Gemmatimonadetes bacterium T265]|nr:cytochrome c [Gemmatimonadetes bacterium T265]
MRLTFGRPAAALAAGALALSAFAACQRSGSEQTVESTRSSGVAVQPASFAGGVLPGIYPRTVYGVRHNPYNGNPQAVAEGRRLFLQYNCVGCHGGRAGGGMGPNLRDSVWIYGGDDTHLFADLVEGRPAGMPAWGGKIPEDQMWKIIAYIHSLATPAEPDPPPPNPTPTKAVPENGAAPSAGSASR